MYVWDSFAVLQDVMFIFNAFVGDFQSISIQPKIYI